MEFEKFIEQEPDLLLRIKEITVKQDVIAGPDCRQPPDATVWEMMIEYRFGTSYEIRLQRNGGAGEAKPLETTSSTTSVIEARRQLINLIKGGVLIVMGLVPRRISVPADLF